jgi:hypothetical protein
MKLTRRECATIRAALEYWKEELDEGKEWIPDSIFFKDCSPLSANEIDALSERIVRTETEDTSRRSSSSRSNRAGPNDAPSGEKPRIKKLKLMVPTYNANFYERQVADGIRAEFGVPHVAMLVHSADGVRIVLGSHDFLDLDAPDIAIERQPKAWAIFLHPIGGGDPAGYIYFLDDGRSYLLREQWAHPGDGIQVLEPNETVPEIHANQVDRANGIGG